MIAIDTNILVYAQRTGAPENQLARRLIEATIASEGLGVAITSIAEFWSTLADPRHPGGPTPREGVAEFINKLLAAGVNVLYPKPGFEQRLMRLAIAMSVRGRNIYDLQIALICHEAKAREIWTNDRDFSTVPGLPVRFLQSAAF